MSCPRMSIEFYPLGTCSDQVDDYNCSCQAGFKGKNCSINIDECESKPCVNAILCEDRINDYQCNCKPGKRIS